jgi:hypothetical protein
MLAEDVDMARESISIDVASVPDVVDLAEEVARTGVVHVLTRDGEALAIVSPVPDKRRRRPGSRRDKPTSPNEWLGDLIGIGESAGPSDVSANIHKYIAAAIHDESSSTTTR